MPCFIQSDSLWTKGFAEMNFGIIISLTPPTNDNLTKLTDDMYPSMEEFIVEKCENHAEEIKCEFHSYFIFLCMG